MRKLVAFTTAAIILAGPAFAQSRPLTIKKRSWLDAGVTVAPGTLPTYVTSSARIAPIYYYNDRFRSSVDGPYYPGSASPTGLTIGY